MKRCWVRPCQQGEADGFIEWASNNPVSGFDPATASYPSSVTWCAYNEDGPLAYQTLQKPIFLESLAPRPGASQAEIAVALRELTQNAVTQAHIAGAGEIYFAATDEGTTALAKSQMNFEELPFRIYRMRISDLEGGK